MFFYYIKSKFNNWKKKKLIYKEKMGQTLSEPITEKESAYCQNENYRVSFFLSIISNKNIPAINFLY